VKFPWTINKQLRNEGQKGKTCPVQGTSGKEQVKEGGCIWWMYFIFLYENKIIKPVETGLSWGGGWVAQTEVMNLVKVYCKCICKPCTSITCIFIDWSATFIHPVMNLQLFSKKRKKESFVFLLLSFA
jgi:hypothetical protein